MHAVGHPPASGVLPLPLVYTLASRPARAPTAAAVHRPAHARHPALRCALWASCLQAPCMLLCVQCSVLPRAAASTHAVMALPTHCILLPPLPSPCAVEADYSQPRATIVLQWRVSPEYEVHPGLMLGQLLDQFEVSVREQARARMRQEMQEAARRQAEELAAWKPTIEPAKKFKLSIQTMVGGRQLG